MGRSIFETAIGFVVILIAGLFLGYAYQSSNLGSPGGYEVSARFLSVGGLTTGADVRIGGVKVGSVTRLDLDRENFIAVVTLTIADNVRLPADTVVSVASDGLLGGRYVTLDPGTSKENLGAGGELIESRDVASIEDLLGRAIFVIAEQGAAPVEKK